MRVSSFSWNLGSFWWPDSFEGSLRSVVRQATGRAPNDMRLISLMKEGILEVLIVNAEDIRHTNLIGRPAYYVILQCGTKEYRTKISPGKHKKVLWNEKFKFDFPLSEWKNLTHIKFRIMDKEFFKNNGFVGETRIHLGGIIIEGTDKGFIVVRPAPYNVVLEDDTYKGQIKIGFKFIAKKEVQNEIREFAVMPNEPRSICSCIKNLWKFPCWICLYPFKQENSKKEHKHE
ncbi:elicitor-responsive protein 3 isoform X2 [Gossypium raimondii]|uniref:elicitor-responsive protein 3 isoform X2 n=1 Tax=Gossypium raimondii TaxID=29730 RepID=UPI00227D1523|nr:elicitor-responsive protein 3 isoform X2 [Gossypium raimondii]